MRNATSVCALFCMSCSPSTGGTSDAAGNRQDANPNLTEVALIPATLTREVDLLFVIDDSSSMRDKQVNLQNAFPSLVSALVAGTGAPSLHIGVTTTNMGVKGADDALPGAPVGGCPTVGDDGALQTFGSTVVNGKFIVDDNGTKNYTGTLAEAVTSITNAGATGCGFEQPLHALSRAIANPANADFWRASARLAIVVLADEDDCSVAHSTLFASDTTVLGPQRSFRCTRYGVQCDVGGTTPDEMNTVGVKSGCHGNEQSAYMTDIERYALLLNLLKSDPRDVSFTAIIGDPGKVAVELRANTTGGTPEPALVRACTYMGATAIEYADPGVRLADLARRVPRGLVASICNVNLAPVMTEVGQRVKGLAGDPCITRAIAQPTACEVIDVHKSGAETFVRPCDGGGTLPCFSIVTDATTCPGAQNLKVDVMRAAPAADTWASVRCAI